MGSEKGRSRKRQTPTRNVITTEARGSYRGLESWDNTSEFLQIEARGQAFLPHEPVIGRRGPLGEGMSLGRPLSLTEAESRGGTLCSEWADEGEGTSPEDAVSAGAPVPTPLWGRLRDEMRIIPKILKAGKRLLSYGQTLLLKCSRLTGLTGGRVTQIHGNLHRSSN